MIRPVRSLSIGTALIGVVVTPCLGQASGRPLAAAAQERSSPREGEAQDRTRPADEAAPAKVASEKAVRETVAAYVAAYNEKGAKKLAALFTEDGTLVDSENVATTGREAISEDFAEAFAEQSTHVLTADIERVRFISPDVAQAEGVARLVSPREATIAKRFVALIARQGDAWKLSEIRDYPAPVDSVKPSERLKELEWMIGEWVDESDDVQISSTVRWGQGKAFLLRDYSVQIKGEPATSGLMIVAWDSQSEQIKSWIFNADGGRGEGTWTRATDNQWVVKAHGSTGDGRSTSATQVITLVNKDAIRTSSTDRVVGGDLARDVDDVIMVRKPLPPGVKPGAQGTSTPAPSPR